MTMLLLHALRPAAMGAQDMWANSNPPPTLKFKPPPPTILSLIALKLMLSPPHTHLEGDNYPPILVPPPPRRRHRHLLPDNDHPKKRYNYPP